MERIKILALDFNGTMFDDFKVIWEGVRAIFTHYGLEAPHPDIYRAEVTNRFLDFYHRHGVPPSATADDLRRIWRPTVERHLHEGKLRHGVTDLLTWCASRDITPTIVSGDDPERIQRRLKHFAIEKAIKRTLGHILHKGEAIQQLATEFQVLPNQIVLVDDSGFSIREAREAGALTVGFTDGYQSKEQIRSAAPHRPAANFLEVVQILAQLV